MKVNSGSCVVMILMVMSMLCLICLSTYKSALFLQDFARSRIQSEQIHICTRGLLQYGIAYAKVHFDGLVSENGQRHFEIPLTIERRGTITIAHKQGKLLITAQLIRYEKTACLLECLMGKTEDKKLAIESFQRVPFPLY